MAYQLRTEKGLPVKQDGKDVMVSDSLEVKIEQLDEKNKSFIAVGSTEDVDRDNDIVRQSGWKLANFKKNPVIPWSHNYYGVPVARSIKTWIDSENAKGPRLLFNPKFDADDDDSMKIFNKYKNGFLTSFSVGFRGIDWEFRDEENRWYGGREFTKQELLEISAVAVPANPNATTRLGVGGNLPENLIQLGYPEVFAKTSSGLFYPITDIAVFSQPKEFEVDKGVIGVNAVALDDDIKINGPVAYIFDGELFDDKSANDWILENAETSHTVKYFDISFDEKNDFVLEAVTTTNDIKLFESSIDAGDADLSNKIHDEDDQLETEIDNDKQEDIESDETAVPDTEDDSRSADGSAEDVTGKQDAEDQPDETNKTGDDDQSGKTEVTIPIKQTIEVTTIIRDTSGNEIDKTIESFATNKTFESVMEYNESKSNELISLFNDQIKQLKEVIEELNKEKGLANKTEIPDNEGNLEDGSEKQVPSEDNEEFFEVDASLITSPDNSDKTTSEETIEIDDTLIEESKSNTASAVVKETLAEVLKKGLKEALNIASGKID